MNRYQKWLEAPYQLEQEKKSGMIPIKSGLGVDYISSEDAENEIAMNEARIEELTELLQVSDESEEPTILSQIQELEDANEMLRTALKGELELYGETIESTLDPKSSDYDPDFARIYEKQQKGLKEIEDSLGKDDDDDEVELEEPPEGEDPIDLSKGKIITAKKFAERDEIPEHLQYKPSVSYNPLKEGFIDAIDPKTGKKWTTQDASYFLSDINEIYISAINESLRNNEKEKAKKIALFLRKYLDKEGFPYSVAVKRFPVIREAYYQFAEDSVHQMARQKKVDYLLGLIDSKLKEKSLPKEKKSELTSKKKELEAIKAKMTEFNEDCYAEIEDSGTKSKSGGYFPRKEKGQWQIRIPKSVAKGKSQRELQAVAKKISTLHKELEKWKKNESVSKAIHDLDMNPAELSLVAPDAKDYIRINEGKFSEKKY